MRSATIPVAIAGGGPVGFALALGLARHGVRSIVFEKGAAPAPYARAGVVLSRTVEIFRSWGLLDAIGAEALRPDALYVCDARDDAELVRLDFSLLRTETLDPQPLFLPQHRTEAILRMAAEATGLVETRFGHEVVDCRHDAAGVRVVIRPQDGAPDELVHAEFLVGADGANSTVRAKLDLALEGETYPTRIMLAVIGIDDARDRLAWPRLRFDGKEYLAALRFARGRWRVIAALSPHETDAEALAHDRIAAHVRATLGPGPFETDWASAFNIHRRHSPRFAIGRIALAGDAAHLNSPVGGQGLNGGIADAHNLAWKLAVALRGGDAMRLLASYDIERRNAVVTSTERFSDRFTKAMLSIPPRRRRPMFALGGRLMRIAPLARRVLRRGVLLDVRYAGSPLFTRDGGWIGLRAPDPALAVTERAVLVLHRLAGDEAERVALPPEVDKLTIERERVAYWKTRAPFAALVRPDGYVGWFERRPTVEHIEHGVLRALGYR
jgi:2-polyprenyl-6-methoxyphenol hydroxylase-like FAD-dependent oxidoreductase